MYREQTTPMLTLEQSCALVQEFHLFRTPQEMTRRHCLLSYLCGANDEANELRLQEQAEYPKMLLQFLVCR